MRVGAQGVVVLPDQGLKFPLQPTAYLRGGDIAWVEQTYHAVHNVLTHTAYAGAYVFGRTRQRRRIEPDGTVRLSRHKQAARRMGGAHRDHHEGFID